MRWMWMIAAVGLTGGVCAAQGEADGKQPDKPEERTQVKESAHAVNAMCPVGKLPIDTTTYEMWGGAKVGFCCKECVATWRAWSDKRKDAFVAKASSEGEAKAPAAQAAVDAASVERASVYPLTTCIVSGEVLGTMGEPVKRVYDGREVRFCCDSCVPRFEADKATYLRKIDEEIIRTQREIYPLTVCLVSGNDLNTMGEADEFVYRNRLVRLCCKACREGFEKDAAALLTRLDKAAADAQRAKYPLDTCPITKKKLGSMGEPAEVVVAGRLVRLCCAPCEPKVLARPWEALGLLEKAMKK